MFQNVNRVLERARISIISSVQWLAAELECQGHMINSRPRFFLLLLSLIYYFFLYVHFALFFSDFFLSFFSLFKFLTSIAVDRDRLRSIVIGDCRLQIINRNEVRRSPIAIAPIMDFSILNRRSWSRLRNGKRQSINPGNDRTKNKIWCKFIYF
jgi:hypothetical protein